MADSILEITNGTITVRLVEGHLETGFHLTGWDPAVAEPKDGGVWRSSPLTDGRKMISRHWANPIETFTLSVNGYNQNAVIEDTQNLRRLLEQAREYWKPAAVVGPVWIKAQSSCETNPRYACIHDYRTPSDNNPYGTGFTAPLPNMAGWVLVLERGQWQSVAPETNACVPLDGTTPGYVYGANSVLNPGFETAGGGGADVFVNWAETAGDGTIVRSTAAGTFYAGAASAELTAGATLNTLIQQNIVVVPGDKYIFSLHYESNNGFSRFEIANVTAGGFILPMVSLPATALEYVYYFVEVTIPAGCISAGIILRCPTLNGFLTRFDNISFMRVTDYIYGDDEVCLYPGVFSVNKAQYSQITHIYSYDDSIATYSANLTASAVPFDLLNAAPAANDILYIGVDDGSANAAPFTNVIFDLLQAAVGVLGGVWEIWTGAAWVAPTRMDFTAIDAAGLAIGPLGHAGVCYVSFDPTGWVKTTVNGIYGWWVRFFAVSIVSGAPRPQQQNRKVYTEGKPYFQIPDTSIGGDIEAVAEDRMNGATNQSANLMNEYILALRSNARGASFNPFLNMSDVQPSAYILASPLTNCVVIDDPIAPTGRAMEFTFTVAIDTGTASMTLYNPLCDSYFGTFRLMLRTKQTSGTAGTITVRTTLQAGAQVVTPYVVIPGTGVVEVVDLGQITIPQVTISRGENLAAVIVTIAFLTNLTASTITVYDLLLIPVDEYAVQYYVSTSGAAYNRTAIISSTDPRIYTKFNLYAVSDELTVQQVNEAVLISTKQFLLQPNEDQSIYTFVLTKPLTWSLTYHRINAAERFLSMRGEQ